MANFPLFSLQELIQLWNFFGFYHKCHKNQYEFNEFVVHKAVVLKVEFVSESSGRIVKTQIDGSFCQVF